MKYNKLVRDKIPEIIKKDNQIPLTHIANDEEYWEKLKEKLLEESEEFFKEPNEEELADILEVINAIQDFKNFDKDKIEKIRKQKVEKRGAFNKRIILDEVKKIT
jgi:predicted house-cleaning noncanonical NTP pyrophosphatase (MazG superfamily)